MLESNSNVLGVMLTKFDIKRAGYDAGYYAYAYGHQAYTYNDMQLSNAESEKRKVRIFSKQDQE